MKSMSWRANALGFCLVVPMVAAQVATGNGQGIQLPVPQIGPRIQPPPPSDPPSRPSTPPSTPNVQVGTLEVRDVAFSAGFTVGRIAFIGLVRGNDSVRADRVEFERLTGGGGTLKIEVPSIKITGFQAPNELFRAMSEGGSPNLDFATLLQRTAATEIAVDLIRYTESVMKYEATYSGLVLKDLRNGRLASARLERTTAQTAGLNPAERFSVTAGETLYQGLDFAEWIRFFTGGGSGGAKSLLDSASVKGIDFSVADAGVRIDKVEFTGFEGRAPAAPFPVAMMAVAPGQQPSPELLRTFAAYFGDMLRYMKIGRYTFEGITIKAPGQGPFVVGAFTLGGVSGRGIDLLEIKGVDVAAPTGRVKFDRFALEKLTYGALLDLGLEAAATGKEPDLSPEKIVGLVPRFAAIRLAGVAVDTPAGPVGLGEFRFELDDRPGIIPEKVVTGISRLRMQVAGMPPNDGRDQLIALGYNELLANAQVQLRWLRNERALVLDDSGLLVDQLGRVDLSARAGNVDLAAVAANPDSAEQAVNNARFESAGIRLSDLGFADRFFGQIAKGAGISPDAMRAGLAAEFRNQAAALLGPALAPGSAEAVEAFIRSPKRIEARASMRLGAPALTLAEAQSLAPPQLLERLTIKIEIPAN